MLKRILLPVALLLALAPVFHAADREALVIGVNPYLTLQPLRAAEADAALMAAFLQSNDYRVQAYFGSSAELRARPTKATVLRALDNLAARAEGAPPSRLVFQFAGHGCAIDGVNYLCFPDADVALREGLLGVDTELIPAVRRVGAAQALLLLDACREQVTLTRSVRARGLTVTELPRNTGAPSGLFMVYASRPGGYSLEKADGSHGYFTELLLRGLCEATNATLESLSRWLRAVLPDVTERETGYAQVPYIGGDYDPAAPFTFAQASLAPAKFAAPAPSPRLERRFKAVAASPSLPPPGASEPRKRLVLLPVFSEGKAELPPKIHGLLSQTLCEVSGVRPLPPAAGTADPWTEYLPADWKSLAAALGADLLAAPSLSPAGKRERLTLSLVDGSTGQALFERTLSSETVHEWDEKAARMVREFRIAYRQLATPNVTERETRKLCTVRPETRLAWRSVSNDVLLLEQGRVWALDPDSGVRHRTALTEAAFLAVHDADRPRLPDGATRLESDGPGAFKLICGPLSIPVPKEHTPEFTTRPRRVVDPALLDPETVMAVLEDSSGPSALLFWHWRLGVFTLLEPGASGLAPLPGGRGAVLLREGAAWRAQFHVEAPAR